MFFSLKNLSATAVSPMEKPWEDVAGYKIPDTFAGDKPAYRKWCLDHGTNHAFISACEGLSPNMRCSFESNGPHMLHGIIVDYDAPVSDAVIKSVLEKPQGEFMPQWFVETFSGNGRLVWVFERGLLVPQSKEHMKRFAVMVAKRLGLRKWMAGFETEALADVCKYYDIGRRWVPIAPDQRLPKEHVELWLLKAGEGIRIDEEQTYNIPLEEVASEVEDRFPNRWTGPFELGARGVRFWDPTADNETAAIVRPDGMQCFTGDEAFVPWRKIFGRAFVERFEADRISVLKEKVAYDGAKFWVQRDEGWWETGKEDFSQWLRVNNFNPMKLRGATCSEVDKVEMEIKLSRRVERALPFIHMPPGIMTFNGQRYLNTSSVQCLKPAEKLAGERMSLADGRQYFPFIYKWLRKLFLISKDEETSAEQLEHFLAWLKYFYENALEYNPRPGQTVVIAGPVNVGKTLLSRLLIGGLVGGYADGSGHLVDGDQWTELIVKRPVMAVDDSMAISDARSLMQFSNRVKKYVANAQIIYNQKYQQTGQVPWFGRIVITCNLDSESLRILPNMDISIRDKISLFKTSDKKIEFPSRAELDKIFAAELPLFARFLLDWKYPEHLITGNTRFGVRPYHHPDLYNESLQQGVSGIVLELLHHMLVSYQADPSRKGETEWVGTATQLFEDIRLCAEASSKDLTPRALATALGNLSKNEFNLYKMRDRKSGLYYWHIGFDLFASVPKPLPPPSPVAKEGEAPKPLMLEATTNDENMHGEAPAGNVQGDVPGVQGTEGD